MGQPISPKVEARVKAHLEYIEDKIGHIRELRRRKGLFIDIIDLAHTMLTDRELRAYVSEKEEGCFEVIYARRSVSVALIEESVCKLNKEIAKSRDTIARLEGLKNEE